MRLTPSPLSTRNPPVSRPNADRGPRDDKNTVQPKQPRKRSLNEAAHKIVR
jgi:hypothetical protein